MCHKPTYAVQQQYRGMRNADWLESQIAFSAMMERFPKLRLRDPNAKLEYKGSYFLRGLAALPMAME